MYDTDLTWTAILIFAVVSAAALLVVFAVWKALRARRAQPDPTTSFTPTRTDFVAATSASDSETAKRFLAAMKEERAKGR